MSNLVSPFIYLASQSPRRQELLKQIGVRFEMLLPSADEDSEGIETPLPQEKLALMLKELPWQKVQQHSLVGKKAIYLGRRFSVQTLRLAYPIILMVKS